MSRSSQKSNKSGNATPPGSPNNRPAQPNIFTPPLQPQPQPQQFTVQHTQRTIFDPDVLRLYQSMVPDAPERVLRVFEQNSETERNVVEGALRAQAADNRRRDWMAFGIIAGGLLISALFAYLNRPWHSGATLAAIFAYTAYGFLHRKPVKPPE